MENKLGTEKILKLCFSMAIPCVLAQLVNLLYTIVDRIYIGKLSESSEFALAGLGLCTPIITIVSAFSSFVANGGAPLASKALGEQNEEKARRILGNGLFLLIFFTFSILIVLFIIQKDLLFAIGASNNTIKYAMDYLTIYLCGTIFVQIAVGLNTFLTAQGLSKHAMISVIIGAIANIALDPLFILVFDLGIKGAALATVLAQALSSIWVLTILLNKKNVLHIEFKYVKPHLKTILAILAIGIAPFVMASTESVIGFVLNRGLRDYGELEGYQMGDKYVSLLTVLQSTMLLMTVPLTGFTQGLSPIISYNYGANKKDRVIETFKINLFVCFFFSTIFTIFMMIFPEFFASFYTDSELILNLAKRYMPIFVGGMLIFGIQRACQTTFVALGEAGISLFIALLRKIILLVPLALILPKFAGVGGIYYSECIADSLAATICGIIFFFRFRSILRKMDERTKKIHSLT